MVAREVAQERPEIPGRGRRNCTSSEHAPKSLFLPPDAAFREQAVTACQEFPAASPHRLPAYIRSDPASWKAMAA